MSKFRRASFDSVGCFVVTEISISENELSPLINIAFVVVFFQAPTSSAHEKEARYAALFGQTQDLPLAVLVAVPVAFLIILTAVFIRALEKAKQKHGVGLVKKTDMNGDAVVMSESCSNKESSNQVIRFTE